MTGEFAPKGAEVLQQEILAELDVSYDGNEEMIDKMVARELKGEEFKASVHDQKKEHQAKSQKREELLKKLGVDPETGEKIANAIEPKSEGMTAKDVLAIRDLHEADLEFVMTEAKLRGQTISEVKTNPYIQNTLKVMAEERKTAEATSTASNRKSNPSSSASILQRASKGELKDDEMREGAKEMYKEIFGKK